MYLLISKNVFSHLYCCLLADGIPTSVDFVYESTNQFVCSFNTANCVIFDLETGKPVMRLDTEPDQGSNSLNRQINRVSTLGFLSIRSVSVDCAFVYILDTFLNNILEKKNWCNTYVLK